MRTGTLVKRNLTYYWRTNLAVVFGVATAVSVLAGALLVGDSVRASLRDLFLARLGSTDYVITSGGMFRERLSDDLQSHGQFSGRFRAACPLMALEGLVTHQESGRRGAGVQVYGVDERFWKFNQRDEGGAPGDREILVSQSLAEELSCKQGDTLLVRVEKASAIPAESLHGRKDDTGQTIRFNLREVLSAATLGEFSIRPQQGAVRAVFVPLSRLQKDLGQQGKVNAILVSQASGSGELLEAILRESSTLEDTGVKLRALPEQGCLSFESESGLIGDELANTARAGAESLGYRASSVLTYLANTIGTGAGGEVPYSVVTALDRKAFQSLGSLGGDEDLRTSDPILLNEWAASDLGARVGDSITLEYYVWEEQGRLSTRKADFRLAGIVPIKGAAADRDLTPDYPGITESESLSDWDPPFPIDLSRVRPRDEQYWDQHRTTPKAFLLLKDGQQLWQSRFGSLTSIRLYPPGGQELQSALEAYRRELAARVDPINMGLSVMSVRAEGLEASRGATDFGQYFVYFSFFIVASALLLAALFFKLGVEQRLREIGLLQAVGFPAASIRSLFLKEGMTLAVIGAGIGVAGALAYGYLMMLGLRTWWVGAVGTSRLALHVSPMSLALGAAAGILTALCCIAWTLVSLRAASPRSLLAGVSDSQTLEEGAASRPVRARISAGSAAIILGLAGFLLLVLASTGRVSQVAGFFGAGTLLLVALFCYHSAWLRRGKRRLLEGVGWWAVSRLGLRNATHHPGRSVLCIALIASATFIIVAVDGFRRDESESLLDKRSGSGGYTLFAESVLPLHHDPNTPEGRESLNLDTGDDGALDQVSFSRFRVRPGDDASCLNLYQPRNPRITAPTPDFIRSARFTFQDSLAESQEEKENPWLLLDKEMGEGAVPVIADANSLTYVLHLGLGDEFVIDEGSASPIRMRVVAALQDSLLQGELIMSEKNFTRHFPDQDGYRFFLLDVPPESAATVTASLESQLADFGFDVMGTRERLSAYHGVENTYLSTFQTLGGLGLVLGTVGLATVLLRNVLERRRELALLRAMGYNSSHFALMVVAENALLLLAGLATGAASAIVAIAPAVFSRGGHLLSSSLGLLLLAVLVTGLAASVLATAAAIRAPLLAALRSE